MNFSKICRVCLRASEVLLDLFTRFGAKRNTSYSEMLSVCTKLKPSQDDGLPRQICKDCIKQLKRTYIFNKQCEDSDKQLRFYLENSQESTSDNNDFKLEENFVVLENGATLTTYNSQDKYTEVKDENNVKDEIVEKDVKIEPSYNDDADDSFWDAEDDNIVLENIKNRSKDSCNDLLKPRKKRGRKKKASGRPLLDIGLPQESQELLQDPRYLSASKKPHQCDICGKLLSTKSNLKAHKICHTDQRPYKCSDCPATFRGHSALFQHKKLHTGETPYHCEYCPKQFARRSGLVNHIRIHTGEKLYSCDVCSKNFVQGAQLSIHMKRHKGDKPYLCQDCGKGFPIKADLKVHQRIHNGEKPYSCHLCTKTFATSGNLSIHIRIHTREVRYNCPECNKGFVTCSAFNVHLKRHKGQRDYPCECGKTFYTSSALKQHKVVHTGEKKYQCKICERKFSQTSHLSRHFKRDHMKPNAPVPPSDYFKLVIQDGGDNVFNGQFMDMQKTHNSSDVKCENS